MLQGNDVAEVHATVYSQCFIDKTSVVKTTYPCSLLLHESINQGLDDFCLKQKYQDDYIRIAQKVHNHIHLLHPNKCKRCSYAIFVGWSGDTINSPKLCSTTIWHYTVCVLQCIVDISCYFSLSVLISFPLASEHLSCYRSFPLCLLGINSLEVAIAQFILDKGRTPVAWQEALQACMHLLCLHVQLGAVRHPCMDYSNIQCVGLVLLWSNPTQGRSTCVHASSTHEHFICVMPHVTCSTMHWWSCCLNKCCRL